MRWPSLSGIKSGLFDIAKADGEKVALDEVGLLLVNAGNAQQNDIPF